MFVTTQAAATPSSGAALMFTRAGAFTTDNQFGAMVSLAYNIGIGQFLSSSVLRFHLTGDHHDAAAAFRAWDKAGGRALPGLVTRRAAEAALYLTP